MNLVVGVQNMCTEVLTKSLVSLGELSVGSSFQCDLAQKGTWEIDYTVSPQSL